MLRQALCIISKPSVNSNWSYSLETPNLGQNQRFFLSCVTLKFDGWPWEIKEPLFYITSSFVHHFTAISQLKMELQSSKAQFRSKFAIFLSRVTLKFGGWPWKTIGHLLYATSSFVYHFVVIGKFKPVELQSRNSQIGTKFFDLYDLDLWPWSFAWTSLLSMIITPKKSWWYDDGNIVKKVWRTYGWTDRRAEVFLELLGRS